MKHTLTFILLVLLLTHNAVTSSGRPPLRADIIIRGGTIVTMDGSSRVIENGAVAVKAERIVAVGTAAEPPPTLDTTLEFDVDAGAIVARRWSRHPRCWC